MTQSAAPATKTNVTKKTLKLLLHMDNKGTDVTSPRINFLGAEWRFRVKNDGNQMSATIFSWYTEFGQDYSRTNEVFYEIRFIAPDSGSISQRGYLRKQHKLRASRIRWDVGCLASSKLFDSQGNVVVELDLYVKEKSNKLCAENAKLFSKNSPFPSDCRILIAEKPVHVDRKYLSIHSPFFKAMFDSGFEEKEQAEIKVEDVDYKEFIELLSVIYPSQHPISVSNVGCLLKLADRFLMSDLIKNCEKFLLLDSSLDGLKKLLLAQQYSLVDLHEHCVNQYHFFDEVKKFKKKPDYARLDDKTLALILKNLIRASPS